MTIKIRFLWEEILVFHGLVSGLGHVIREDRFDLCDNSFSVRHDSLITPVDSPDESRARDRRGEEGTR